MPIKGKKPKDNIPAEGEHEAFFEGADYKPTPENPTKVIGRYRLNESSHIVSKDYPANLDEGSPLRQDVEKLLGRSLTAKELQNDFEVNDLKSSPCSVVVMHKSGPGGRPKAEVSLVKAARTLAPIEIDPQHPSPSRTGEKAVVA